MNLHVVHPMTTDRPTGEALLTTEQVAEQLVVAPDTLVAWRCRGGSQLPFVRLGRKCVRYRASDVQAFIERNTHSAR